MILGLDTATAASVAAVSDGAGATHEARHDPAPGERPGHAERLLALAEQALGAAGAGWEDVERIAVGLGPGGFTGLRIGIATARGLAQTHATELAGVSTLHALALPHVGHRVLAVIDARRGEAFAAGWDEHGERLLAPVALGPAELAATAGRLGAALAVGDGALRFREQLESAGLAVPGDADSAHRVAGAAICRLGAAAPPAERDALLPDYVRAPDAKPPSRP